MTKEQHTELLEIARELKRSMQCTCDLDRWEPEPITGHSWVCDIHKLAVKTYHERRKKAPEVG